MSIITPALRRLKAHLEDALPEATVRRLADDLTRQHHDRTLTPVVTTYLFLRQVLHGHTAVGHLRHLSGLDFTDSAYCQARQRLPVAFCRALHRAVVDPLRARPRRARSWRGHRVFGIDGSSFSVPDTPELQEQFGQPSGQAAGCGFPVAHLLVAFDLEDGYLLDALAAPRRTHDLSRAALMHPALRRGDLAVGDRAFGSYAHLALLKDRGLDGLFRAHQRRIVSFRPGRRHARPGREQPAEAGMPRSRWLRKLGKNDQLVEYFKPDEKPDWMTAEQYAELPESLVVREVRFTVRVPGRRVHEVTVVTTLLDPEEYPAKELARLYEVRWRAEVDLRHLKTTLGMDVLRCRTFPGVMKEMLVFVIVYDLVRRVMAEAARRQGEEPDRISFVDALRWLAEARRGEGMPRLRVNPERPGRYEPRVKKRRPKPYGLMRKPRAVLKAALLDQTSEVKGDGE